ncbi:MAG TPA: glycosyl hydrolase [Solirubrobacterales bacterium]|nr:glycosyl hydrolase [Solirubrobacterales bacterium]
MVQGGVVRIAVACVCALGLLTGFAASAGASMYFGATISGETYGQEGNAPTNTQAWNLFERHAGRKVAILNQGQPWATFDKAEMDATGARGAIPLVTMGLGSSSIDQVASGGQDAAIKKWTQEAKAWGHPFLFAPWWEMNGDWYAWGRQPKFIEAWRRFHKIVAEQGATNVTWTWLVNSIWSDPESDPTPWYPGDAYVDWAAIDSYNWGRMPAQPDRWKTPDQVITPTLKILQTVAPAKPVAIVENGSTEFGGNKTDWIREMLASYLPHHPAIKAYLWFNWNFQKGEKREDWPIESSAPAQQGFRRWIQSSLFVPGPVLLPNLTKVPPPAAGPGEAARGEDLSAAAEMTAGPDAAVADDGTTTVVWSARSGPELKVFARRIAANGSRGDAVQLSSSGGDALEPQVALAPDGTATVAWAGWDGANFRIRERRIGADGVPEEATRTLSGSGRNAFDPQLDVSPEGEATVVWKRYDGSNYLVQAKRIAPDGTSESPAERLSEAGLAAVEPEVAVAEDGSATAVWSRFVAGAESVVQTRRIKPDGSLAPAPVNLSAAGGGAIQPQVALDPDGEATVVWNRFDGANWVVQGQRLSPAGAADGAAFNLSASGRSAAQPQVAIDAAGVATAVWERYDGSNFVIQARRVSAAGAPAASTVQLSSGGRDAADPQLALSPDGDATVLWSRSDGINWIVQRRDLAADGTLGTTTSLSAAGRGAGEGVPAWGGDGTLAMVWKRFNGADDVVQAETVPGSGPPPPPPPPPPSGTSGDPEGSGGGSGAPLPAAASLPDNSFSIGRVRLNKRRGSATVAVIAPGPGLVSISGAVPQLRTATAAGKVVLRVLPSPAQRRALRRKGSARLRLTIAFQPRGGVAKSRDLSLRLKKARSG